MNPPLHRVMDHCVRWHQPRWLVLLSLVLVLSWVAVAQHAHAKDTGHHLDCALCLKQGHEPAALPSVPPALPDSAFSPIVPPLAHRVTSPDPSPANARAPPR